MGYRAEVIEFVAAEQAARDGSIVRRGRAWWPYSASLPPYTAVNNAVYNIVAEAETEDEADAQLGDRSSSGDSGL